ncbi:allantoinase [Pullulanibacillus sp. KACC 23026]|uniref:allantoinase n=1 Tax=Pullulanibacillus sp. KACC 23026 TaxID=3028315 RepID=UPI0023B1BFD3|nr:allantoinase [Pullulanibacillus sp. KACC 23026]WEG13488.1 allantoinase [Pullulanibacillus sp. KACC 23026]
MSDFDLLIRNGMVVLPNEVKKVDLAIKEGRIIKIGEQLSGTASEELDVNGKTIFPGLIDVHVHFSEPGREHWEGFETGSRMMAAGGCTTYFDMPLNGIPSTVEQAAFEQKAEIGSRKSVVDFALWGGLVPGNIKDLRGLAESGVIGFKAFLSDTGNDEFERADDLTLLDGMKEIASLGKILALHAESAPITNWLLQEKKEKGLISADNYLETRPILAEAEAVERAIYYAQLTGCPLHFVHISSQAAVEKIEAAKQQGLAISVETCPHYLLFSHDDLVEKGAIAKCAPPLRKKDEQKQLIRLLREGKFDMVSSDHSPCPYSMKDPAKHTLFEAWGGISGGQFTLLSMLELALEHEIPLTQIAKWTAEMPAQRFNLETKGKIEVGMDADLAIVSFEPFTVREDNFHAKHKQSLYVGHTFPCTIEETINRGKTIYKNGKLVNHAAGKLWINRTETKPNPV